MDKKVTVLTPHGRRVTVKVTLNTTLLQILEEACEKFGYDSNEYCLKHHNKEIGLTQMFRFSGLPNNCLLEMEQVERKRVIQNVDICLQLQDGTRLQAQFLPSNTLLEVIEKLNSEALAACESPVILYMRQEIVGKEKLATTTLKSLGITEGRAMIRLIDKKPEELKTQASVYIPPTVKEKPKTDDEEKPRSSRDKKYDSGAGGFAITKDLVRSLKKPDSKELGEEVKEKEKSDEQEEKPAEKVIEKPKYDWGSGTGRSVGGSNAQNDTQQNLNNQDEQEIEIEYEFKVIGERNAILYTLDSAKKDAESLPDSFFDLTVHDLKLILRDLKNISSGNDDAPLLTEKLRELEYNKQMLNKIALYKNCVMRIQFPDRYVLQGMFIPIDTITNVKKWVKSFLADSEQEFHMYTIPPKKVLPLDKTLLELDFVPNALVHFAFDEDSPKNTDKKYIKSKYLDEITTAEGALYAAKKFRKINARAVANDSITYEAGNDVSSTAQPEQSKGAIPKRPRNNETR